MSLAGRNAAHYKVPVKKLPKATNTETVESRYWKAFKYPVTIAKRSAVTSIEMVPNSTRFLTLNGVTVDSMDPRTSRTESQRSIVRSKDKVLGISIRGDGKLFALGGKIKVVQIFELSTRSQLRSLRGHTDAVQTLRFSSSMASHIVTGSHDKTVRLWDYSSESCIHSFTGHSDYITRVAEMPNSNGNLWCSSSFDHTVRLWDFRTPSHQLTFDQGSPIEDLIFVPSTFMLASAGLNGVYVWDVLGGTGSSFDVDDSNSSSLDKDDNEDDDDDNDDKEDDDDKDENDDEDDDEDDEGDEEEGEDAKDQDDSLMNDGGKDQIKQESKDQSMDVISALRDRFGGSSSSHSSSESRTLIKPIARLRNHQKAVTALRFDGTKSRLLSGSVDHNIKVYDLQTFSVTHTFKNHAPVLSFDISFDNSTLVVGMSDGSVSIRKRPPVAEGKEGPLPAPGSIYGIPVVGSISEYQDKLEETAIYRATLSRAASEFDYRIEVPKKVRLEVYEGLLKNHRFKDALDAALDTKNPLIVVSLIESMMANEGLTQSIDGRDEESLLPILEFLINEITDPRFSAQLITFSHIVLDTYAAVIGQSFVVDKLFFRLRDLLQQEVKTQMMMQQLNGIIEMIINNSAVSQTN